MPLMSSKPKKSMKSDMDSKPASLAMAYGMKRKPKKMAKGGKVDESAKSEMRPMPEERDKDSKMISRNSGDKPAVNDHVLDQPTVKQAQKPSRVPLKHPKMVPSNAFSVRMRDEEDHLESSDAPASPSERPPKHDNEEGADRQGPSTPSLKMKKMAEGGMINEEVSMHEAEEDHAEHPAHLEQDNDQMKPSDEEIMADHFAEGGEVDEDVIEHAASVASAIMAKRRKEAQDSGSPDEDSAEMYAEGGEVDLSINADEEPNHEDDYSFEALKKENYSESEGLDQLDSPMDSNEHGDSEESRSENKHDNRLVSAIRRKMMKKSPISR